MQEMREAARRVVRAEMRARGMEPETASITDAERVLDEITNAGTHTIAACWWRNCDSRNQTRLWRAEWRKWQYCQESGLTP